MPRTSSLKANERRRKFKQRAFARRRLRELKGGSPLPTPGRPGVSRPDPTEIGEPAPIS